MLRPARLDAQRRASSPAFGVADIRDVIGGLVGAVGKTQGPSGKTAGKTPGPTGKFAGKTQTANAGSRCACDEQRLAQVAAP